MAGRNTEPIVFDTALGKVPMPGRRGLPKRRITVDLSKVPDAYLKDPVVYFEAVELAKRAYSAWLTKYPEDLEWEAAAEQDAVDEALKEFDDHHPNFFDHTLYDIVSGNIARAMMRRHNVD